MPIFMKALTAAALLWCGIYLVSTAVWEIGNNFRVSGYVKIAAVLGAVGIFVFTLFF